MLAIVLFSAFVVSCCCPTNPAPNGMISDATALEMQNLYLENQHAFINEALGLPPGPTEGDNINVHFDLADFEEYICLIKKIAKDSSYSNLGLRVYFGAKLYKNGIPKSTLFFAPTFKDSLNNPKDYLPGSYYNMGDVGNIPIGGEG